MNLYSVAFGDSNVESAPSNYSDDSPPLNNYSETASRNYSAEVPSNYSAPAPSNYSAVEPSNYSSQGSTLYTADEPNLYASHLKEVYANISHSGDFTIEKPSWSSSLSSSANDEGTEDSSQPRGTSDWNRLFQAYLKMPDSFEKFRRLTELGKDFIFVAESYGRIIISELFVPQKTIQPLRGYGVAGGAKYICQGILFKFTLDTQVGSAQGKRWLYGGETQNDEKAMKSACNELKGLSSLFQCQINGLHFPLMVLIHYRGYCLLAVSVLPLSGQSLKYGSNDSGVTVHASVPDLNAKMKLAGNILNLDSHLINGTEIYGPGDIEGHLGDDNKFYLLDFGRLMPPEAKLPHIHRPGNHIFYDLLRPTFVRSFGAPLCSDALTGWCGSDPNRVDKGVKLLNATVMLHRDLNPTVAAELDKDPKFGASLVDTIHKRGLNCRHLGILRSNTKTPKMKENILIECIARTLNNELRHRLRTKMVRSSGNPSREAHLGVTFAYLKRAFYKTEPDPTLFGVLEDGETAIYDVQDPNLQVCSKTRTINRSSDNPLPKIFAANYTVPTSVERTVFFEVKLQKGSNALWIGLVETKHKKTPFPEILNIGHCFFGFKEGRCIQKGVSQSLSAAVEGDTVGFFYRAKGNILLLTKGEYTLGEEKVICTTDTKLIPMIILTERSQISYIFKTTSSGETAFPLGELCEALSAPAPGKRLNDTYKNAEKFWKSAFELKQSVQSRFPHVFSAAERSDDTDLRNIISMKLLLNRFQDVASVQFSERIQNFKEEQPLKLSRNDIVDLNSRVSHMTIIDDASGQMILRDALKHKKKKNKAKILAEHLFALKAVSNSMSKSRCQDTLDCASDYLVWGRVQYEIGLHDSTGSRLKAALHHAEKALNTLPTNDTQNESGKSILSQILWLKARVILAQLSRAADKEKEDGSAPSTPKQNTQDIKETLIALAKHQPEYLFKRIRSIQDKVAMSNDSEDITIWYSHVKAAVTAFQSTHNQKAKEREESSPPIAFIKTSESAKQLRQTTDETAKTRPSGLTPSRSLRGASDAAKKTRSTASITTKRSKTRIHQNKHHPNLPPCLPPQLAKAYFMMVSVGLRALRSGMNVVIVQEISKILQHIAKDEPNALISYLTEIFAAVVDGALLKTLIEIFDNGTETDAGLLPIFESALKKLANNGQPLRVSHFPNELLDLISRSAKKMKDISAISCLTFLAQTNKASVLAEDIYLNDTTLELTSTSQSPVVQLGSVKNEGHDQPVIVFQFGAEYMKGKQTSTVCEQTMKIATTLAKAQISRFGFEGKTEEHPIMPTPLFPCFGIGHEAIIFNSFSKASLFYPNGASEAPQKFSLLERTSIAEELITIYAKLHSLGYSCPCITNLLLGGPPITSDRVEEYSRFRYVYLVDMAHILKFGTHFTPSAETWSVLPPEAKEGLLSCAPQTAMPTSDIWTLGNFLIKLDLVPLNTASDITEADGQLAALLNQSQLEDPTKRPGIKDFVTSKQLFRRMFVRSLLGDFPIYEPCFQIYSWPFTTITERILHFLARFELLGAIATCQPHVIECFLNALHPMTFMASDWTPAELTPIASLFGDPSTLKFLSSISKLFSIPGLCGTGPRGIPGDKKQRYSILVGWDKPNWVLELVDTNSGAVSDSVTIPVAKPGQNEQLLHAFQKTAKALSKKTKAVPTEAFRAELTSLQNWISVLQQGLENPTKASNSSRPSLWDFNATLFLDQNKSISKRKGVLSVLYKAIGCAVVIQQITASETKSESQDSDSSVHLSASGLLHITKKTTNNSLSKSSIDTKSSLEFKIRSSRRGAKSESVKKLGPLDQPVANYLYHVESDQIIIKTSQAFQTVHLSAISRLTFVDSDFSKLLSEVVGDSFPFSIFKASTAPPTLNTVL